VTLVEVLPMTKRIGLAVAALLLLIGAVQASDPAVSTPASTVEFEPSGQAGAVRSGATYPHRPVTTTTRQSCGSCTFPPSRARRSAAASNGRALEAIAKTTKYVAFGSAYSEINNKLGRDGNPAAQEPDVRTKDKLGEPIPYPLNHGLYRLRTTDVLGERNPVQMLQTYLTTHPLQKR
jgi:hypothetical protein